MKNTKISALKAGAAPIALGLAIFASPAFAQDAAADCAADPTAADCADSAPIIVTGSIFRRADTETASPVTTVTTENLDSRGISTVQDGLQQLASNNGPALTNSFSANGAFAGGASAVSLRGLSTNSTLVLFDGQRAAYYPLADDGSRNFVDLNTIPDDIIERIEVLRDGASSAYGADAIAGVVNIITKRSFTGVGGRAEAGISERGDAATYRLSMTAGIGDLDEQGWNAYLSGFYYKSDGLKNSDRGYPFNTDDLRQNCFEGTCGSNNIINGRQDDGLVHGFGAATAFAVRAAGTTRYQYLNGCNGLPQSAVTAGDLARADNAAMPTDFVCQEDLTNLYGNITPDIERFGVSSKVTAALGDSTEAYFEANFLQSRVSYEGIPASIRANAPTGIFFPRFSTSTAAGAVAPGSGALALPVFVCANGVGTATGENTGCTAANGILNPDNPFAAQGLRAQLIGRLPIREFNQTRNRAYRAAFGVNGSISDKWDYTVQGTAMHTDLERTQGGYVYIQNFLNAIARGQYNFRNPSATPQSVLDQIAPTNVTPASSDLYQLSANIAGALMELPGGPLRLGVGASIYYEGVNAPSANSDINGPTQRYFRLNAFGTSGNRTVKSVFAEMEAPILPMVELSASGRYDDYSSGQNYFSPKVGIKVKPIQQVVLRGTFSKGFRIPSFGEANALPTTGFVTASRGIYTDSFLAQYGCSLATYTSACPTYVTGATYGLTTLASPNLEPEKSQSITAGILVEPMRNVSFTVDYYRIKKTGAITNASTAPAIAAYYNNQPIPDGFTVIADAPDINTPNARPRIAFVQSALINSDTIISEGLDFGASAEFALTDKLVWNSELDASYIIKLETQFPGGGSERYDGTLGNFNLTAGSGTPKWHGSWLNSFTYDEKFTLNVTANMFGGYDLSAMDQGTGYKDCGLSDGTVPCRVADNWTFDLGLRYKVNDKFTIYTNVLNLFDKMPPIDPVTYGAHLYNAVQGGNNILGRYFKTGVKVGF